MQTILKHKEDRIEPVYSTSPPVNSEIELLVQAIIEKFINKWFEHISLNTEWQHEIKKTIAAVSLKIENRLTSIEWNKYILFDLTQILRVHIKEVHDSYSRLGTIYAGKCNSIEELFQKRNQHLALLAAADSELLYLRGLVKGILLIVLPKETATDEVCVHLLREIIGSMALRQTIDKVSDPNTIGELIIKSLSTFSKNEYFINVNMDRYSTTSTVFEDEIKSRSACQKPKSSIKATLTVKDLIAEALESDINFSLHEQPKNIAVDNFDNKNRIKLNRSAKKTRVTFRKRSYDTTSVYSTNFEDNAWKKDRHNDHSSSFYLNHGQFKKVHTRSKSEKTRKSSFYDSYFVLHKKSNLKYAKTPGRVTKKNNMTPKKPSEMSKAIQSIETALELNKDTLLDKIEKKQERNVIYNRNFMIVWLISVLSLVNPSKFIYSRVKTTSAIVYVFFKFAQRVCNLIISKFLEYTFSLDWNLIQKKTPQKHQPANSHCRNRSSVEKFLSFSFGGIKTIDDLYNDYRESGSHLNQAEGSEPKNYSNKLKPFRTRIYNIKSGDAIYQIAFVIDSLLLLSVFNSWAVIQFTFYVLPIFVVFMGKLADLVLLKVISSFYQEKKILDMLASIKDAIKTIDSEAPKKSVYRTLAQEELLKNDTIELVAETLPASLAFVFYGTSKQNRLAAAKAVLEPFQNHQLNKYLVYAILDDVIGQIFPELLED